MTIPLASAKAIVWSSTGFLLPLLAAQEAQFFQYPMVRARPPGGGVLSTMIVVVAPAWAVKFPHRMLLSTFGLATVPSGGLKLLGTNWPRLVCHAGRICSHIW